MSPQEDYLELTDPARGEVVARVYANRVVFIRAEDYEVLLKVEGAQRVPEGISFPIDGHSDLLAAEAIKR